MSLSWSHFLTFARRMRERSTRTSGRHVDLRSLVQPAHRWENAPVGCEWKGRFDRAQPAPPLMRERPDSLHQPARSGWRPARRWKTTRNSAYRGSARYAQNPRSRYRAPTSTRTCDRRTPLWLWPRRKKGSEARPALGELGSHLIASCSLARCAVTQVGLYAAADDAGVGTDETIFAKNDATRCPS